MSEVQNKKLKDAKGTGKRGELIIPTRILLADGPFDRVSAFKEFIKDFKTVVNNPIRWAILNTDPEVMVAYAIICELGKSPTGVDMYGVIMAVEFTSTSLFGFRYIQGKGSEIRKKFYTDLVGNSFKIGKAKFEEFVRSLFICTETDMDKFVKMADEQKKEATKFFSMDPNDEYYFLNSKCTSEFLKNLMNLQIEYDEMKKGTKK